MDPDPVLVVAGFNDGKKSAFFLFNDKAFTAYLN
jgi:hypothetical protein